MGDLVYYKLSDKHNWEHLKEWLELEGRKWLAIEVTKGSRLSYEYMWGDKIYNNCAFYYEQPVNVFINPTFDLINFADEGGYEWR